MSASAADSSSLRCLPTASIRAFSRLSGAVMESTKEIISLGASSDSVAIWYMGDMGLSVMAITSALREQANCTAWMAILE